MLVLHGFLVRRVETTIEHQDVLSKQHRAPLIAHEFCVWTVRTPQPTVADLDGLHGVPSSHGDCGTVLRTAGGRLPLVA
jgi:hypothetical protein